MNGREYAMELSVVVMRVDSKLRCSPVETTGRAVTKLSMRFSLGDKRHLSYSLLIPLEPLSASNSSTTKVPRYCYFMVSVCFGQDHDSINIIKSED